MFFPECRFLRLQLREACRGSCGARTGRGVLLPVLHQLLLKRQKVRPRLCRSLSEMTDGVNYWPPQFFQLVFNMGLLDTHCRKFLAHAREFRLKFHDGVLNPLLREGQFFLVFSVSTFQCCDGIKRRSEVLLEESDGPFDLDFLRLNHLLTRNRLIEGPFHGDRFLDVSRLPGFHGRDLGLGLFLARLELLAGPSPLLLRTIPMVRLLIGPSFCILEFVSESLHELQCRGHLGIRACGGRQILSGHDASSELPDAAEADL